MTTAKQQIDRDLVYVEKLSANRAELDALAIQARDLARGTVPMPSTVAARDALLKKLCEAFARMWFNERFDNE